MGWLRLTLGKGHPTSRVPSPPPALPWLPQTGAVGLSMGKSDWEGTAAWPSVLMFMTWALRAAESP